MFGPVLEGPAADEEGAAEEEEGPATGEAERMSTFSGVVQDLQEKRWMNFCLAVLCLTLHLVGKSLLPLSHDQ